VPVACIAKAFTAALLVQESESLGIALSSSVASVLALGAGIESDTLARISLRQLLDHTHGLDGSRLTTVPRLSAGRIDCRALCEELANSPAIHEPGAWYSYGNVGSWLGAAILEHVCDRTYEDLFEEQILDKISARRTGDVSQPLAMCPATGGGLALSARHFLAFLKAHFAARCAADPSRGAAHRLDVMPGKHVAMPGWCLERGASVGWKYFGAGWYGYDGVTATASSRIRLRFEERIGIVVLAEGRGAGIALARLFGRTYPELCPASLPTEPDGGGRPDASVARTCVGEYVNRSRSIRVGAREDSCLQFTSRELRDPGAEAIEAVLIPYRGRLYIPRYKARRLSPVVEFVGNAERATHLWDGSQLLRRT
jgi:CubicO group peptidase (beta-lactamase class C family)